MNRAARSALCAISFRSLVLAFGLAVLVSGPSVPDVFGSALGAASESAPGAAPGTATGVAPRAHDASITHAATAPATWLASGLASLLATPALVPLLPPDDLTPKQLKKLGKLGKQYDKRQEKLLDARLRAIDAHVTRTLASDTLDAAEVDTSLKPKQLKKLKKALGKASKRHAKALKIELKAATRLELVTEGILELDATYFDVSEVVAGTLIDTPVVIQEARPAGALPSDRIGALATFGLPFSQEQAVPIVDGVPQLGVIGSDVYQFRALDEWPDGSARWVLCDIQADVAAAELNDTLVVVSGPGGSDQPPIGSAADGTLLLDTGPMQVLLQSGGFNLFKSVTVDGELVARAGELPGVTGLDLNGRPLHPANTQASLEENGPARAVVRVDGLLKNPDDQGVVPFTCRITARRGSRELEVTFTVQNSRLGMSRHARLESLELVTQLRPATGNGTGNGNGNGTVATIAGHAEPWSVPLTTAATSVARLYQGYTANTTTGVEGVQYLPHLPKVQGSGLVLAHEGYLAAAAGQTLHSLGNRNEFPRHGFVDLTNDRGGLTVAIQHMPALWPAALAAQGDGLVRVGLFPEQNPAPFTFVWRQHESRSVLFAFHGPTPGDPLARARAFDHPVVGRAADYAHYDRAGVFAYDLLTRDEHEQALGMLGIDHTIVPTNPALRLTRYLYKGTTGGLNNHASIERRLGGEWLRDGTGGNYLSALDLALYKSEWQIARSSDFKHADDAGPSNNNVPTSSGHFGDDEHRYREGILLAYHLTGDPRFAAALFDEAENLKDVSLWQHERSMYQTLRAMALVVEFTGDDKLAKILRERLQYFLFRQVDVDAAAGGWGWDAAPGQGTRGYYVNSSDNNNEKPPGENFQARGFISASLGPLGLYHAARVLPEGHSLVAPTQLRLQDLARWTREELFPHHPDPAQQRLAYSYAVSLRHVTKWESVDFHPILLGMSESWRQTGDADYLAKGAEQLRAAKAHGDLHFWDARLDVQHFLSAVRERVLER